MSGRQTDGHTAELLAPIRRTAVNDEISYRIRPYTGGYIIERICVRNFFDGRVTKTEEWRTFWYPESTDHAGDLLLQKLIEDEENAEDRI